MYDNGRSNVQGPHHMYIWKTLATTTLDVSIKAFGHFNTEKKTFATSGSVNTVSYFRAFVHSFILIKFQYLKLEWEYKGLISSYVVDGIDPVVSLVSPWTKIWLSLWLPRISAAVIKTKWTCPLHSRDVLLKLWKDIDTQPSAHYHITLRLTELSIQVFYINYILYMIQHLQ